MKPNVRNVFARIVTAAEDDNIESVCVIFEIFAHTPDIRMGHDLDSALPKFITIRWDIGQVIWDESDVVIKSPQNSQDLKHPQRTRVPIGHGQVMIDDEDALYAWRWLFVSLDITIDGFVSQNLGPTRHKRLAIDRLILLGAGKNVSAAGDTFVVDDRAQGLVEDL